MAVGNAIVNTTKFKPLSVAEWAAPLKEYATKHDEAENVIFGIQSSLADYEAYINSNPDSEVSQRYKSYINDLDQMSQELASNGITSTNRANLLNLRRDYIDIIKPIKTGITLYQNAANKRSKDSNKGIIGPDISPETYINNPSYVDSYTTYEDIIKDATRVFKSLKNYSTDIKEVELGNGQIAMVTPQSYSAEDYINAFDDRDDAPTEIKEAINALRTKYGSFAETSSDSDLIDNAIKQAAGSAVVNPKVNYRTAKSSTVGNSKYTLLGTDSNNRQIFKDPNSTLYTHDNEGKLTMLQDAEITVGNTTYKLKEGGKPGEYVLPKSTVNTTDRYITGYEITYDGKEHSNPRKANLSGNNTYTTLTYSDAMKNLPSDAKNDLQKILNYMQIATSADNKKELDNIVVQYKKDIGKKGYYSIIAYKKNSNYKESSSASTGAVSEENTTQTNTTPADIIEAARPTF